MSMRTLKFFYICISLVFIVGCKPPPAYQSRAEEVFPTVAIKYAALFRMDQQPISLTFFRDRWTVLVFGSASCEADCQHRLALLNEVKGVQTLLVIDDLADHSQLRALKKKYPSVAISMGATAASIDNFMRQFEEETIPPADRNSYIYLISPVPEFSHFLSVNGLQKGEIELELESLKRAVKME